MTILALVAVACGDDSDTTTAATGEEAAEPVEITEETPVEAGDFTTLVEALRATDLVDTLAKYNRPFTFFAPTDEAFQAELADLGLTAEELLSDTNLLNSVLAYHVVLGEYSVKDLFRLGRRDLDRGADPESQQEAQTEEQQLLDGWLLETFNGDYVALSVDGDSLMVNDATVINADIDPSSISEELADNFEGAIHVIDAVLVPSPSMR